MLSEAAMREFISSIVARFPSQREEAAALGISTAYLSDILSGKRQPGKKVLEALGYRKVTMYLDQHAPVPKTAHGR